MTFIAISIRIMKPTLLILLQNFTPSSLEGLQFSATEQAIADLSDEETVSISSHVQMGCFIDENIDCKGRVQEDVVMEMENSGTQSSSGNGNGGNSQDSEPDGSDVPLVVDVDNSNPLDTSVTLQVSIYPVYSS